MNRSEEDYIKAIYELKEMPDSDEYVGNQALVKHFKHSPQSVNEMVKKLVEKNMLEYKPYKGTRLTDLGMVKAIELIRKHRIWEVFLTDSLGYSWDEVHGDAELLEHITSQKLEERLYNYLGRPKTCPHGNVIPGLDGVYETVEQIPLTKGVVNTVYKIDRVTDESDLLKHLNKEGIKLNDRILVKEIDKYNEIIHFEIKNRLHYLNNNKAINIFIKVIEEE